MHGNIYRGYREGGLGVDGAYIERNSLQYKDLKDVQRCDAVRESADSRDSGGGNGHEP